MSVTFLVKSLLPHGAVCPRAWSNSFLSIFTHLDFSSGYSKGQAGITKPFVTASASCFQPKHLMKFISNLGILGLIGLEWMEDFLMSPLKHQSSGAAWQRFSVARCDCCFLIHLPTLYSWAFEWLPGFACLQSSLHYRGEDEPSTGW